MKFHACGILLLAAVLANGCSLFHHSANTATASPAAGTPAIITPDHSLTARVVSCNATGRFVVLTFPVNQMPRMDQGLFLYRNGMKVGEVKITGPQQDNNIVADIVTGDAQVGDEVRDK